MVIPAVSCSLRVFFPLPCSHESRVKHVVIESKQEPVAGVLYNITPNGPFFSSLYDLIEEAKKSPIIQNHMIDVVLGKCPPKVRTQRLVICTWHIASE